MVRPQGKGVYEECALGLVFMVVKPHPVAMIQSPCMQVGYNYYNTIYLILILLATINF